jgi:hypothetical protein
VVYFFWQKITCVVDVRRMPSRNLCDAAKTLHGREAGAIRAKRQQALAELKLLERMGKGVGIM